jgi:protein tyrosine/serine phosphatase
VKTVIDLREEGDESSSIPPGVRYVRIPVSPWSADRVDVSEVLRQIKSSPKPIFIHCQQGRDRTGLAVAAYRLAEGMGAKDACQELRNFRVNFWWDGPIERRIYELNRDANPGAKKLVTMK